MPVQSSVSQKVQFVRGKLAGSSSGKGTKRSSSRARAACSGAALVTFAGLLGACGSSGGAKAAASGSSATSAPSGSTGSNGSSNAPSGKLTNVSVQLSYYPEGYDAPIYYAQAAGYFKAEGLNVSIHPSTGSGTTAEAVGNGNYNLGFVDAGVAAQQITKGVPITVVAGVFQKSPDATIFLQGKGISTPKDLEGKVMGDAAGTATSSLLPAFFAAAGVDASKVKLQDVQSSAENQLLLAGRIASFNSYGIENVPELQSKGAKATDFVWADYGLDLLGESLVANNSFLQSNPAVMKSFLAGFAKAYTAAQANPSAAVQALLAAQPSAAGGDKTAALGELKGAFGLLHTKASANLPIFVMAQSDWQSTLSVLAKYEKVTGERPVSSYYTNQYLPGGNSAG